MSVVIDRLQIIGSGSILVFDIFFIDPTATIESPHDSSPYESTRYRYPWNCHCPNVPQLGIGSFFRLGTRVILVLFDHFFGIADL